jgi:predicted ATP-dependent Lon-type protease
MKFRVTLKDPDAFYEAIREAIKESLAATHPLADAEREAIRELRRDSVSASIERWVEYGEYVTIEFDIEAMTATVVPLR